MHSRMDTMINVRILMSKVLVNSIDEDCQEFAQFYSNGRRLCKA